MSQQSLEKQPVTRRDFILRLMQSGLSYANATTAYKTMCLMVEEGIISGSKIHLGRVGALIPVWKAPRDYHMHFKRLKGNKVQRGVHRTYFMDGRFDYKFRLFKKFTQSHNLRWLPEDFPAE